MEKLIKKATDKADFGLDWFVQAGHGGNGNRNCQLVEDASLATPVYQFVPGAPPAGASTRTPTGSTLHHPEGYVSGSGARPEHVALASIQEFQYQLVEYFNAFKKPLVHWCGDRRSWPRAHLHVGRHRQIPASLATTPLPTAPNATASAWWPPYTAPAMPTRSRSGNTASTARTRTRAAALPTPTIARCLAAELDRPELESTAMKLIPAAGVGHGTAGHNKTLGA